MSCDVENEVIYYKCWWH